MLRTYKELRDAGWADLLGKWTEAVLFALVYFAITGVASNIPAVGSILALLIVPIGYGWTKAYLTNRRTSDKKSFNIERLFDGFKDGQYGRVLGTMLLVGLYTILWLLLLIIPGIIKSLSYSLTEYILIDNPELSYNEAIELSMDMMNGHKMDLFVLYLTFIGWFLLCLLTLGIGFLWFTPYVAATEANFYEDVKREYESRDSYAKE